MTKTKMFISFDYQHDQDLRDQLLSQDRLPEASFQAIDCSVEELLTDAWTLQVRERIKQADQVIFLCGEYTHLAKGVSVEYTIAREEKKPYFMLQGRENKATRKPRQADKSDKVYAWTSGNIKMLMSGAR